MPENMQTNLFEANMALAKFPFAETFLANPDMDGFNMEMCKNGSRTMKVAYNGKERYIHSKYNPEKEAEAFADSLEIHKRTTIICFGFGFGYYAKAIAARLGEENRLVIIEPLPQIMYAYMQNEKIDWLRDEEQVKLYLCHTKREMETSLDNYFAWGDINRLIMVALPSYAEIFPELYSAFLATYRNGYNAAEISRNTAMTYVKDWQLATIRNVKKLVHGYDFLKFQNIWAGSPVVMVSAGPSLNRNAELLHEIKGKVPIVCVYTAYKALKKYGIEPDLVVSVDAKQLILENEQERQEKISVPLLCMTITDERLIQKHEPKVAYLYSNLDSLFAAFNDLFGREVVVLDSGGSVACSALAFCHFTGASQVVMLGQDLAFTGNKTHAEGTFYDGRNDLAENDEYIWIEDVYGGKVPTDRAFYSFKTWFDDFVQTYNGDTVFIDATEGGAKIQGTEIMPFREVIDKYCVPEKHVDVERDMAMVFEKGQLFTAAERVKILDMIRGTAAEFRELESGLRDAVKNSQKLQKIYEEKEQDRRGKAIRSAVKNLDAFDKKMDALKTKKSFFSILFQKVTYDLMNYDLNDTLDEETYIVHRQLILYSQLEVIINLITPELEKAADDLEEIIKQDKEANPK